MADLKAVLVGGTCDGLVLRIEGDTPPRRLIVLGLPEHTAPAADGPVGIAFAGALHKPIIAVVPIHYALRDAVPETPTTRVCSYYPVDAS